MRIRQVSSLVCLLAFISIATSSAFADDWKPIDKAALSKNSPVVDKDADAEALLWEIRVDDQARVGFGFDSDRRRVLQHYLRIKIFTDRGKVTQSTVRIVVPTHTQITDLAARTIKPDGKIIELNRADVLESTTASIGGVDAKVRSFTLPNVEPGCLIEYRYKETRYFEDDYFPDLKLDFSRDIPVQLVKCSFRSFLNYKFFPPGYGTEELQFKLSNGANWPVVKEKDGSYSITATNVPAFQQEPYRPPQREVCPWLLARYDLEKRLTTDGGLWRSFNENRQNLERELTRPSRAVKGAALKVAGNATTEDQKLERLYDYCRTQIKNIDEKVAAFSPVQRGEFYRYNRFPAATLAHRSGTRRGINDLFAAMARSIGMEVRSVEIPDRSQEFSQPVRAEEYFSRTSGIAVKVGGDWRVFDPANIFVPYGMLAWNQEGVRALVSDSKDPAFVQTPVSPTARSMEKRTASLSLLGDGTLEGDIHIELTGHLAIETRQSKSGQTPDENVREIAKEIKDRINAAEISDVKIENATDPSKPVRYSYHLRVPAYAQRSGNELLVEPGLFQYGKPAVFPATQRKYPVYFDYGWMEADDITIMLPAGYSMGRNILPSPVQVGGFGRYDVKATITADGRTLKYARNFVFGAEARLLIFSMEEYPHLKAYFDAVHQGDAQPIILNQDGRVD